MPVRTVCGAVMSSVDAVRGEHVAERGILPARHEDRQVALRGRQQPAVLADRFRRVARACRRGARDRGTRAGKKRSPASSAAQPFLEDDALDAAHRFFFRNAGVGDAVQMPIEQRLLVGRRQIAIVRHPLVVVVRDEIEDVFFEIGAGAADRVNLAAAESSRPGKCRARRCSSRRRASGTSPPPALT